MMILRTALALSLLTTACVTDYSSTEQDLDPADGQGGGEPHDAKVTHVRGNAGHSSGVSLLSWHGGVVQHATTVKPIFWGASWNNASFVGDKITGINALYAGMNNTSYMSTNHEYTDGSGNVGTGVNPSPGVVDLSAAAKNGSRTSTILAEVCKVLGNNALPNAYYPVYTDSPRGHAGYCAWHSAGTCPNGTPIQFGFFFNLDGDAGCDPGDSSTGHSQGLAALANVSGHELSEMVTDPKLDAWYDASGAENSDKCAWTFSSKLVKLGSSSWKIQGNWSNAAYGSHSGYDGAGCIDGQ